MLISLTEEQHTQVVEAAKEVTIRRLDAVLEILRRQHTSGEFAVAEIDQRHLTSEALIAFVTRTYEAALENAIYQLVHAQPVSR